MTLYTVQHGDTISSIAAQNNIPLSRLEQDNNLSPNETLVEGQSLIIAPPEQTYITKDGDTLSSISAAFGVSILQLLRNNPKMMDETLTSRLDAGTEIIISYKNKAKKINVNGFINSFIRLEILRKTLPYLTYITILNYRVNPDGSLEDVADTEVIKMAKEFGVAPLMFISTLDYQGKGTYGSVHRILSSIDIQNTLIANTLSMLKEKGYYGLYIGFQHVLKEDLKAYVEFVANITKQLNTEGYEVFISLIPSTFGFKAGVPYEDTYYSEIGNAVNYVTLITYQWTSSFIPEFIETTPGFLKEYLDFVITQIPPEKIYLGLTRIAYDWELPYVEGETLGTFNTLESATNLARQVGAAIQTDDATKAPYYYYYSLAGVEHLVWFKNLVSYNDIVKLAIDYNLKGIAIWNIMYFFIPMYLLLNSQYNIETILTGPYNSR